jgi:Holliday junction resolvase RusA-like endonuclease
MKITLPYPPTTNNLYFTRNGKRFLSNEGRDYKANVLAICFAERVKPLSGELVLTANVYRPRKTGDLDNCLKIIQDSLKGSCFEDDRQIVEIHAFRFDDKEKPRVEVLIEKVLKITG